MKSTRRSEKVREICKGSARNPRGGLNEHEIHARVIKCMKSTWGLGPQCMYEYRYTKAGGGSGEKHFRKACVIEKLLYRKKRCTLHIIQNKGRRLHDEQPKFT